jgi:cholesterol transport system auxiliary component
MRKLSLKLWCTSLLLSVLLCGCVSLDRSYPEKHYFVLEINRDVKPLDDPLNGIVEVADIRISPRYEGQSFIYRISDGGYESDFYNQFLIPPTALVTEEVRRGLAQSGISQYVIDSSNQIQPTYRLDGTVNAIYGDFRNATAARAVLEMEFFLTKPAPGATQVLMAKRYSKSVPLTDRTPEALVKGWNEALKEILRSLVTDLKAANLPQ